MTGLTQADVEAALERAAGFLAARRQWAGGLDLRMEAGAGGDGGEGEQGGAGGEAGAGGDGGEGAGGEGSEGEGTAQLGEAGKQALDRMKGQRNAARTELNAWKALGLSVDDVKALQQKATGAAGGEGQGSPPDLDAVREEGRKQARAEALRDRVVDKIEARAAKGFADPEDAVAMLSRGDLDAFVVDGKVDVTEIDDALAELLQKKPHLAATGGTPPPRFQGGGDGGPLGNGKPPTLAEQIAAAEKAGDNRLAMALKARQLTAASNAT